MWHGQPAVRHLSFRLAAREASGVELAVMVPLEHGDVKLAQIELDGRLVPYRERAVGGVRYGWLMVSGGSHEVTATYG